MLEREWKGPCQASAGVVDRVEFDQQRDKSGLGRQGGRGARGGLKQPIGWLRSWAGRMSMGDLEAGAMTKAPTNWDGVGPGSPRI